MKEGLQRIKIATACGLDPENNPVYGLDLKLHDSWSLGIAGDTEIPLPDYLNDLNAMHQAEKVLTYEQLPVYVAKLKNPVLMKPEGVSDFDLVHANASQRAEALLRTLGLWDDA